MVDREKVGWCVPSDEWDAFISYVRAEHGEISGYMGREVEHAMREWIDADAFEPVEALVDRLIRAAGRTPAQLSSKKRAVDPPAGGDNIEVQCRVDPDVRERFAHHAETETNSRKGIVLARALRERRDGGRARRVRQKAERVVEDAEALLAELNSNENELGTRERRTILICERLGPQFTRDDLERAIEDVAGGSDPTIQDYADMVLDRLEYVQHPNNPEVYIPKAKARECGFSPDKPAYYRKQYHGLSREEKVRGLQIELARKSLSNNGRYAMKPAKICIEIFDNQPSESHVRDLIDRAEDAAGFDTDSKHGAERLKVNLRSVTDNVRATAKDIRGDDVNSSQTSSRVKHDTHQGDIESQKSDSSHSVQPDSTIDVDEDLNALMNATPVTDGGVEGADDS